MRAHLIEVGPAAVRRLCCGGATVADADAEREAFASIDDPVALVGLRPVSVESLWRQVLASVDCGSAGQVTIVHPSWWSPHRLDVIRAAAQDLAGLAEMRSRSWLLAKASPSGTASATLVVEIADGFVVATGDGVAVEARNRDVEVVAEAVADSVLTTAPGTAQTAVIDAPATVRGARRLAAAIVKRLPHTAGMTVVLVDDIRLRRMVGELKPSDQTFAESNHPRRAERAWQGLTLAVIVAGAVIGVGAVHRHTAARANEPLPTTYFVEGHVALEIPAQWPTRRIVAGPGSARVEIRSPTDPDVALQVTQSRVALPGMDATAEFLKSAIDAAPVGVFVDFNPAARSAGHAVVTYREVRDEHDIRWTVWVDKLVRISIGCQNPRGRDAAVRRECETAVRSARALI
ncbi:type VII secretion-associated protein [Mycobacterium sp. 1245111.1]|nr:type VII secretion-associated protein [Mycobacterium sp. 1245111.1]